MRCRHLFTTDELYSALQDPEHLRVLLYLREKNPRVPLNELAQLLNKNADETFQITAHLTEKGFIEPVNRGFNLNPRARNALNALLQ
ncbi:hypothetical protein COX85_00335 [Candidatus Micrarchaeota archaeon CG_4_10_14_0_2_um_filter_55_9]|nr:MAG: hypothetical protein AUJ15_01455 [Candidatus Micrarchaeota archaeon CG1_02_55_41]PIZ92099.1 MAG: hypothetical protein COX85_00335 [Candidatus Micrarchaeota archaeon CG_4_10_14_0_2_um_filter_55_9]PJD01350.1 MAG: hypothetical protein COU38_01435 [Candidatus Micrarchaeota archaeon CG10_big_fil_rev_8_21_14_0_10_54_18]